MSPYSHYERICRGHNRIWWLWVFTNHFPIEPNLDFNWKLVLDSHTNDTATVRVAPVCRLYCLLTFFGGKVNPSLVMKVLCTPSLSSSVFLSAVGCKSFIPHHSFSLARSPASRCHDLFSGCLNRLAVIKSYAMLMTLSWGGATVPRGRGDWSEVKGNIGCRDEWLLHVRAEGRANRYTYRVMEVQVDSREMEE